jgi:hypothetical protein
MHLYVLSDHYPEFEVTGIPKIKIPQMKANKVSRIASNGKSN